MHPAVTGKQILCVYKCREKGHLGRECPHIVSSPIIESQQTPNVSTQQTSCATLFPATNTTLSQKIIAETQITVEL